MSVTLGARTKVGVTEAAARAAIVEGRFAVFDVEWEVEKNAAGDLVHHGEVRMVGLFDGKRYTSFPDVEAMMGGERHLPSPSAV